MTVLPPDGVFPIIGQAIGLFVERTIRNEFENQILAETRKLLLPKFMSGEIRLRDA